MTARTSTNLSESGTAEAHAAVMKMATGFWVSQIVRTAADLSLAEHLQDGPRSAAEIAVKESADQSAVFRLMRACTSLGLLAYEGDRFAATPLLSVLHRDSPLSVRNFALSQTAPGHWLTWGRTSETVRQGVSQAPAALGSTIFEYFGAHPEEAALFGASMTDLSMPVIHEAVEALELAGAGSVVDVGGADGAFVLELMAAHPDLHGTVLELPHAVAGAKAAAERRGFGDRFTSVAGDFLDAVPAGDLYLLKYILHDWNDATSVKILQNCRKAMRPGGRIVVVDMVIAEQDSGFGPLMDIAMLTMLSSRERTEAEFDALFAQAGLRRVKTTPVQSPYAVVETVAI